MRFSLENNPSLSRLPALDGLRGVAVIAVMLFHFGTGSIFRGGSLGVDVFFVLSGFLITTLLLQEWAGRGGISLSSFYLRRSLRLLPALTLMLVICLAVTAASGRLETNVVVGSIAAFTYSFNWLTVLEYPPAAELNHLWSLSIEEQYYLLWPGLLLVLLKSRCSPLAMMALTILLIGISASMPLRMDAPENRLYFSTDYRLHELLVGSLLAQMYVAGLVRREMLRNLAFKALLAGSVLAMTWWLFRLTDRPAFLFDGTYLLVALCSAVMVLGCCFADAGGFARILSNRALAYVGTRSYALYLWHIPIQVWLSAASPILTLCGAIVLSFIAAEVSFRLVEAPALRLRNRARKAVPESSETVPGPMTTAA